MTSTNHLSFGPFVLQLPQRTLTKRDEPIRLGSRALEILVMLVENAGNLVTRDDLLARVWPDTVVDDSALRVHMSAVRKALGNGENGAPYIVNESGRGYRFAAIVQRGNAPLAPLTRTVVRPRNNLPASIGRIFGRVEVIDGLLDVLSERRLLTIAGPGGIGKTTVGLAVAHKWAEVTGDRAYFIDFAPVSDPALAISTIASVLGVPVSSSNPMPELIRSIGESKSLLLLDNCEHLVEPIADIVEQMLRGAESLCVLVTSRETLRAEGEWVHRLSTLESPAPDAAIGLAEASFYPAVRLFVDRAAAASGGFQITESNQAAICEICRRLDGIALAIEFAAARTDLMDVHVLANQLNDRFALLTKGRRTALPRQQTLRAMLDWSYEMLDTRGQTVLRRVALLRTTFDIAAVAALATGPDIGEIAVFDAMTDLVAKSLITSNASGGGTQYRLLDTTRYYALDLLERSPDAHEVKRRHGLYCRDLFTARETAWEGSGTSASIARHGRRIDDIRAAVDWAFSDDGDIAIGLELVVAAAELWFDQNLTEEFLGVAERALAAVAESELSGSPLRVELLTIYGNALWHTRGPVPEMRSSFELGLTIARELGDRPLEMRSVWGIWMWLLLWGANAESMCRAQEFNDIAEESGAIGNMQTARTVFALTLHFQGPQNRARAYMEEMLAIDRDPSREHYRNSAQLDGYLSASGQRMRMMWVQGETGQALALSREIAAAVIAMDHDLTTGAVLATGVICVTIWAGEFDRAKELVEILRVSTRRSGLNFWGIWTNVFDHILSGTPLDLSLPIWVLDSSAALGSLVATRHLISIGRDVDDTMAGPEILRLNARDRHGETGSGLEADLLRAIDLAERFHALSWVLRATMDLAQLRMRQGRNGEAENMLTAIVEKMGQADGSPDLVAASATLVALRDRENF